MTVPPGNLPAQISGTTSPFETSRPADVPYGIPFAKQCGRCGQAILAVRASKKFCDRCLLDHRKPVREQRRPARAYKLRKIGLTLAEYDAMVDVRSGCCDICGGTPVNQGGSLCVDHDHQTGRVRGLLCSPCNRAIGLLGDSADAVARAAGYLAAHEASEWLHQHLRSERGAA